MGAVIQLGIFGVLAGFAFLSAAVKIVREYERVVVFRLGRYVGVKGPGVVLLIPFVDKIVKVDLRVVTRDIPTQDVITRDNVSVSVNAVLYFRVIDASKAVVEVENYLYATSQLAQTTLRSVCGQAELDELLSERDRINQQIQGILDGQTDPWGIKVVSVEVKHIDLPQEMKRAMARQAEAERERRAKIISAEGEFQASERLAQAANRLATEPISMQLRFLQTLGEIASEHHSTVVLPIPIDLLSLMMGKSKPGDGEDS